MELAVKGEGLGISEDVERRTAEQVVRLRRLFPSEPEIQVVFSSNDGARFEASVAVGIRGYCTMKAKGKGEDEVSSLNSALKKVEWKYRLFWARGSFRFSDCC